MATNQDTIPTTRDEQMASLAALLNGTVDTTVTPVAMPVPAKVALPNVVTLAPHPTSTAKMPKWVATWICPARGLGQWQVIPSGPGEPDKMKAEAARIVKVDDLEWTQYETTGCYRAELPADWAPTSFSPVADPTSRKKVEAA
jgi:hypothetical protein